MQVYLLHSSAYLSFLVEGNLVKLEEKIDALSVQLKRSDSLLSATTSKILVLQELGKIK